MGGGGGGGGATFRISCSLHFYIGGSWGIPSRKFLGSETAFYYLRQKLLNSTSCFISLAIASILTR